MARLSEILSNDELIAELKEAKVPEDLIALEEKFL